jgi:chromate transporter
MPQVFLGFLRIGATAFGGGSSTSLAMRRLVLTRGWLGEQEFLDTIVISRITPGITNIAQAMLIGKRVCGLRGVLVASAGMMLPAVVITVLLARLYQFVARSPASAVPLLCVAGVAAGFAVALALQLLRDVLRRARVWSGLLWVAAYAGISLVTGNPIVLLAIAVIAGAALPRLFRSVPGDVGGEPGDVGSVPGDVGGKPGVVGGKRGGGEP